MTFYKDRYLRTTGRFHAIWRAAHGIPVNPNVEDEEIIDICADLAQLLNPTPIALQQQQMLSLRFASILVAGTAARHLQLANDLLQATATLLHEIQTSDQTRQMNNDSANIQIKGVGESYFNRSEINTENVLLFYRRTSTTNIIYIPNSEGTLQNTYEIIDESFEESDGRDNSKSLHCEDHTDEDNRVTNILNTRETRSTSTEKSRSNDSFDLLVTAEIHNNKLKSNIQGKNNTFQDNHKLRADNNDIASFTNIQDDFTSPNNAIEITEKININQCSATPNKYFNTSALVEFSPIIEVRSDRISQYEANTIYERSIEQAAMDQQRLGNTVNRITDCTCISGPIFSTPVLKAKSPILESNFQCKITNSENNSSSTIKRRLITSVNDEPINKRICFSDHQLCSIKEECQHSIDQMNQSYVFDELRIAEDTSTPLLELRSPIHIEIGTQEVLIQDVCPTINRTLSKHCTMDIESTNDNYLDTSSWITMTNSIESTSTLEPARMTARTLEAALLPGTRGVGTAPATRRRRKRCATVYRSRKVKMTRRTPPLTRLRQRQSGASLEGQV